MPEDFSILHGFGQVQDSKRIGSGVFIGGSRKLMEEAQMDNSVLTKPCLFTDAQHEYLNSSAKKFQMVFGTLRARVIASFWEYKYKKST